MATAKAGHGSPEIELRGRLLIGADTATEVAKAAKPGEVLRDTLVRLLTELVEHPKPLLHFWSPAITPGAYDLPEVGLVDADLYRRLLALGCRSSNPLQVASGLLEAWADGRREADGRRLPALRRRVRANWSREKTLRRLRALARVKRRPLNWEDLFDDGPVYEQALRHFGTIEQARAAVGLPQWPYPRLWTRETVIAELTRIYREGIEPTTTALRQSGNARLLNAVKLAGGLVRARRLAGIPEPVVDRSGEPEAWDADRVLAEIDALRKAGEALASSKVPSRLCNAGIRYFGNWRAAVEAAGIDYLSVCLKHPGYSDEELLMHLRRLAAERPALTLAEVERHRHAKSWNTRFGSIEQAASQAGLLGWPRRQRFALPSRRETLALLRRRRRQGKSVAHFAVYKEDGRLVRAVQRHFENWTEALQAAGLSTRGIQVHWTAELVVRGLQEHHRRGPKLPKSNWGLYFAARRLFGSLNAARQAAGVPGPAFEHWDRERILKELRRNGEARVPKGPLYSAAIHHFGSLNAARAAAGLGPQPNARGRRTPRPRRP